MKAAITFESFGGTFIGGGQRGRQGCFIPMNQDLEDEHHFLNCHDRSRPGYIPLEEFGESDSVNDLFNHYDDPDYEKSLAEHLLDAELTPARIKAAAMVAIENPEILLELYRQAVHPEEIPNKDVRERVRRQLIGMIRSMVSAMLAVKSRKEINNSLAFLNDQESGNTVLACFARFAREELNGKIAYGAALPLLRTLGHSNVFAHYLD